MSGLTLLFGAFYIPLIYAGSLQNSKQQEGRLGAALLGNNPGPAQLVNLPGLIPGPPGAALIELPGLAPQPNGGPLLNLAPLPIILPGVISVCVDEAGQPLIGNFQPGCSTRPPGITPRPGGVPPGTPVGPGVPPTGPGAPPGGLPGAGGPFADLIDQIIKLILSLLGPLGAGVPAQPPLLGFTPIPPAQLVPGIPGLPANDLPIQPGVPAVPVSPQNPFFGNFPFPIPESIGFGIPGGLQFGVGVPGFINIGVPGGIGGPVPLPGSMGVPVPLPEFPGFPSRPIAPSGPLVPSGPLIPSGPVGLGPCGRTDTSRILNGGDSSANQYCWHATVFSRGVYKCSATILNKQYVMTTAFCVIGRNAGELNVRVGESNIGSSVGPGGQYLGIEQIFVHPDYNPTSGRYENNIAIIKLAKPIENSPTVCPICLPSSGDGSQFNNKKCTVTGFGSVSVPGGRNSQQLKAITLPIIPYATCARTLSKYVLNFQPHSSFLCAGGVLGQDACTGDGGGALACLGEDGMTYSIAGIASWGAGCGKSGIPAVYSNIASLMSFINGIVLQ